MNNGMTSTQLAIVREISFALIKLNADIDLRSIVGSWGDTLSDELVLELIEEYNKTGMSMRPLKGREN